MPALEDRTEFLIEDLDACLQQQVRPALGPLDLLAQD
jgi:hypothetical protein